MILQSAEPSLDLGLLCGCIRPAVADHRSNPGSQQFHLPVLIGSSVIKVENLRLAVLGDGRLHDGHMLAEATTTELTKAQNPQGLEENRTVAKQGGTVAGNARKEIEAQTGRPVVTAENASTMLLGQAVAGMIEGVVKDEDDKE